MIEIPLTQGRVALVDDCDAALADTRWYARRDRHTFYAYRKGPRAEKPRRTFLLHRVILGAARGVEVDHVNGDGLDCRRANLRLASRSQNQANRLHLVSNVSGFRGVSFMRARGRWLASIRVNRRTRNLGAFESPAEAARAYDAAARSAFGPFARLDFPGTEAA